MPLHEMLLLYSKNDRVGVPSTGVVLRTIFLLWGANTVSCVHNIFCGPSGQKHFDGCGIRLPFAGSRGVHAPQNWSHTNK